MKFSLSAFAAILVATTAMSGGAFANGLILSTNGFSQIGVNDDGSLNAGTSAGTVGIGYKFPSGFQDALTPGCLCESWGVAANGVGGQVGQSNGNQNIGVNLSSSGTSNNASGVAVSSFTSNTFLNQVGLTGLTITQTVSQAVQTATGALFRANVTLHNGTGAGITNLQYARVMDWDVPPTPFAEVVTIKGTGTTTTLIRSTDDGFANANPISAVGNMGLGAPINTDFTTGPADHGALFVFDFGSLANNADYVFNIYYGSGANQTDALALLGLVGPQLYSLGYSDNGSTLGGIDSAAVASPTFIFAFNGVGGEIIVPPTDVPEPASLGLLGLGLLGLAGLRRRFK